ncbi:MAG: Wzz/FepE/Etk N-terminal domain-containing protein [Gallionellaceae bacterium]|jgi:uncharacterized protein involved in exopolysaccharide biosynthesis
MSEHPLSKPEPLLASPQQPVNYHPEIEEDEINLLDLLITLLKHKVMIIVVPLLVAVLAAGYSLTLKNIYRAEVLLAPVGDEKGGGASSMLGGLGGLASLAGVSLGGGGSTEQNIAILKSREFLVKFVEDTNLMPILFEEAWDAEKKAWKEPDPKKQPRLRDGAAAFLSLIIIENDKKTSLITLAIEWTDKKQAAEWANELVLRLNKYLGEQAIARGDGNLEYLNQELMRTQIEDFRKTLFDLIAQEQKKAMLAKTQKDFAFRVLDHAVEPDKKIKPKRALIVLLAGLVAFFLTVIWAFVKEAMLRAKQEPEQAQRWAELRQALSFKRPPK